MNENKLYDVAIVGGGLAGLALAIQCARNGHQVIVFEKEKYPFHKVCGEYISLESWNFLEELGLPLSQMNLPLIRELLVTAPNGKSITHDLPLGGFGISRYQLDYLLASIARDAGAIVQEETKVEDVIFASELFSIQTAAGSIQARVAAGSFGKKSNLDVKWKRAFTRQKPTKLNNYIGIKYHVQAKLPESLIALHNFKDGYCGISRIEDGRYCLCYLTTASNLAASHYSIPEMEMEILCKNPYLKDLFTTIKKQSEIPVTISQISFAKKTQVLDHLLLVGDAAGMITPLCGNGMSMALHGSKLAYTSVHQFLAGTISRKEMEQKFRKAWKKQFASRLRIGRMIQRFFGSPRLSNLLITVLKPFPSITTRIIRATHGQPF